MFTDSELPKTVISVLSDLKYIVCDYEMTVEGFGEITVTGHLISWYGHDVSQKDIHREIFYLPCDFE